MAYFYGRLKNDPDLSNFSGSCEDIKAGSWVFCKIPDDDVVYTDGYDVIATHYRNDDQPGGYLRIVTDRLPLNTLFDDVRLCYNTTMEDMLREFSNAIMNYEFSVNIEQGDSDIPEFTEEEAYKVQQSVLGEGGTLEEYRKAKKEIDDYRQKKIDEDMEMRSEKFFNDI